MLLHKLDIKRKFLKMLMTVLMLAAILYGWLRWGEYEQDYWKDIGSNYEEVVDKFGEPIKLEYEETCFWAYYDNLAIVCYNKKGTTYLADITDSYIRFGFLNIGVGSHKNIIEGIYCLKKKIIDVNENQLGVVDGMNTIVFEYDENNRVKKMYLSRWYY